MAIVLRGRLAAGLAIFLMVVATLGFAVPSNPPLLSCEPNECVRSNDAQAMLGDVPFDVHWPTPPDISREVFVTPSSFEANDEAGARLILTPGNYGNLTFSRQDQEIVIEDGAVIDRLTITGGARRLIIRSEVPRTGRITNLFMSHRGIPQDVLIDGIRGDSRGVANSRNALNGIRVAIVNSWLTAEDFSLYTMPRPGEDQPTDLILVNNIFESVGSAQANVRIQNPQRLIIVGNRIVKRGSGHHSLRIHAPTEGMHVEQAYIADNQIEGARTEVNPYPGSVQGYEAEIGTVWFMGNRHYDNDWNTPYPLITSYERSPGEARQVNQMYVRNNQAFGASMQSWEVTPPQHWEFSDNTVSNSGDAPVWHFR